MPSGPVDTSTYTRHTPATSYCSISPHIYAQLNQHTIVTALHSIPLQRVFHPQMRCSRAFVCITHTSAHTRTQQSSSFGYVCVLMVSVCEHKTHPGGPRPDRIGERGNYSICAETHHTPTSHKCVCYARHGYAVVCGEPWICTYTYNLQCLTFGFIAKT